MLSLANGMITYVEITKYSKENLINQCAKIGGHKINVRANCIHFNISNKILKATMHSSLRNNK